MSFPAITAPCRRLRATDATGASQLLADAVVRVCPVTVGAMIGCVEVVGPLALDPLPAGVLVATESVPAGWPSPAQDYFDGDIDLNSHLIRNRPATFIVRVAGDSMTGAGIYDGDELVVDRSLDPGDGDIVIAIVDTELTVKRLRLTGHGPELHPENPRYPILRPTGELLVWGVVTTCLHHLHRP